MFLGIVSNCWRAQLDEGEPIDGLMAEALRRGYRAIELRQGCLGRYERGAECVPDAGALAELPRRFPELTLNVALAFPFGSSHAKPHDPLFEAGIDAAEAAAGRRPVYLRLVDVTTTAEQAAAIPIAAAAARLAALARPLARRGGVLAVENARQPWCWTLGVLGAARRELGDDARHLRLCYDPCNLLMAPDVAEPGNVTRSLAAGELASVHVKQQRGGRVLPTVADGDIDWMDQARTLRAIEYRGPILFEVAPNPAIWENLEASRRYVMKDEG